MGTLSPAGSPDRSALGLLSRGTAAVAGVGVARRSRGGEQWSRCSSGLRVGAPWVGTDWASLVTRCDNVYEPGLFDVRSAPPRVTALGKAIPRLRARHSLPHPVAEGVGWWIGNKGGGRARRSATGPSQRPFLLTGADARVAAAVLRRCAARGLTAIRLGCTPSSPAFADQNRHGPGRTSTVGNRSHQSSQPSRRSRGAAPTRVGVGCARYRDPCRSLRARLASVGDLLVRSGV